MEQSPERLNYGQRGVVITAVGAVLAAVPPVRSGAVPTTSGLAVALAGRVLFGNDADATV